MTKQEFIEEEGIYSGSFCDGCEASMEDNDVCSHCGTCYIAEDKNRAIRGSKEPTCCSCKY